jgi:cytochrome c2
VNRNKLVVASVAAMFAYPAIAHADDAASRGARVVDEWCRMCHQRVTDKPDPDLAPPYEEIVRRRGRDEAYFSRFLQEDHFPMTTFRLFDHEKADVVAYLMALQRRLAIHP